MCLINLNKILMEEEEEEEGLRFVCSWINLIRR